jgi:FtsH ternary system domain X6
MTIALHQNEANLLAIARLAAGVVPGQRIRPLLQQSQPVPQAFSRQGLQAIRDTLSRGLLWNVARSGGWMRRHGQRWWDQPVLEPWQFGTNSLTMLQWVLDVPLISDNVKPLRLADPVHAGDELLAAMLARALAKLGLEKALLKQADVARMPAVILSQLPRVAAQPLRLDSVKLTEVHGVLLSGLAQVFAEAWINDLTVLFSLHDPAPVEALGRAQAEVLTWFLAQVEALQRRDLATFLVEVAAALFGNAHQATPVLNLSPEFPVKARAAARQAAGGFGRALAQLHRWDEAHRQVRFVDEGYDRAQTLLREWQPFGASGFARVAEWTRGLDSLGV